MIADCGVRNSDLIRAAEGGTWFDSEAEAPLTHPLSPPRSEGSTSERGGRAISVDCLTGGNGDNGGNNLGEALKSTGEAPALPLAGLSRVEVVVEAATKVSVVSIVFICLSFYLLLFLFERAG